MYLITYYYCSMALHEVANNIVLIQVVLFLLRSAEVSRVVGGIDWHSYSQLILRPYGITKSVSLYATIM